MATNQDSRGFVRDRLAMYEEYREATNRKNPRKYPEPQPGAHPHTVALVGKSHAFVRVNFGEPGWEYWGLNGVPDIPGFPPVRAHTRWFQLHPPHYLAQHYPEGLDELEDHWSWQRGVRLYMDEHYPRFPDSEPYPKAEVEALTPRGRYHTSSFDWMLALAIHEGFERIVLAGCDFYTFPAVMNGEPISARPCLEYWCGVAEGRGIAVDVIGGGHMFKTIQVGTYVSELQYGFEREPMLDFTLDVDSDAEVLEETR